MAMVVVILGATLSFLLVTLVDGKAIELPSAIPIPNMPKFNGKTGGKYKCIGLVDFSLNLNSSDIYTIDNFTVKREDGLITLISGSGSSNTEFCNGTPLSVRLAVYMYVEGIGWQYFQEYSRNDICPDVNIAPDAIEKAKEYSTGEMEPHNPPWQPGNYAWSNVPTCVRLKLTPELPYRRIKGRGQLILDQKVIGSGEGEIIIAPDVGTEKYGVILV